MKIKILGNGGAINYGLPYNSFVIDDSILCEAPPDIMLSLQSKKINPESIKTIFISHFHGDHFFGLPFLLLHLFFASTQFKRTHKLTIIGPKKIESKTLNALILAFSEGHPVVKWTKKNCTFKKIGESKTLTIIKGYKTTFIPMDHFTTTFGFVLEKKKETVFAYTADTLWCDTLVEMIIKKPKVMLIDLNGEDNDPRPVHVSEADIINKAIPLSKNEIHYYGTHLKLQKKSKKKYLTYVKPGMTFEV